MSFILTNGVLSPTKARKLPDIHYNKKEHQQSKYVFIHVD